MLYTKIHTENNIALETITPERIKDSKKAKTKIAIQASSEFVFKNDSIFSNIRFFKKRYFTSIYLTNDIN